MNKIIKYKIGEISTLARVTVRTLRHYEEIGLLEPEIIDRWTGYRYYSTANLQQLITILKLKELGFTLTEIRELYDDDNHIPAIEEIAKLGYEIAGAPRANDVDGIWNQDDTNKWLTIIQVPVTKP